MGWRPRFLFALVSYVSNFNVERQHCMKTVCRSSPLSFDFPGRGFCYRDMNFSVDHPPTSQVHKCVLQREGRISNIHTWPNCLGLFQVKTVYSLRSSVMPLTEWIQKLHFQMQNQDTSMSGTDHLKREFSWKIQTHGLPSIYERISGFWLQGVNWTARPKDR